MVATLDAWRLACIWILRVQLERSREHLLEVLLIQLYISFANLLHFILLFFLLIYDLFSSTDFLLIGALFSTLLEELTFACALWLGVAGWVALALVADAIGATAGEPALLPVARLRSRNRRPLIDQLHLLLGKVEGVPGLEFNLAIVLRLW